MKLSALLVITILGLSGEVHADDGTWCTAGFTPGPEYGKGGAGSTQQDACSAFLSKKKAWHFHGFVEKAGQCYACWDEESSTCETAAPKTGFRYLGGKDCGSVPIGKVGVTQHFDPKAPAPPPAPPPPPPPKAPAKPTK